MKNGIYKEDGNLIYYKNGEPYHAGAIQIDSDIYYVGRHGKVATGQHIVHSQMCNGILKRGTYTFSEEGKLIKDSYIAPKVKKRKHHSKKNKKTLRTRDKKALMICGGLVAVFALLIIVAVIFDSSYDNKAEKTEETSATTLSLPAFSEPLPLCSKQAQRLYEGELSFELLEEEDPYKPFVMTYSLTGEDAEFSVSESADMSGKKTYILSRNEDTLTIDNLKTGCTYYYEAKAGEETKTGTFTTSEGTRYVYIPGTENTRDIGGYVNSEGKTVRQGMLIRGTELDGLSEASYYLSNSDAKSVMEQFGFVFEMDLRNENVAYEGYTSRLGDSVNHRFFGAPMYGNVFSEKYNESLKSIFSALSKKENYPMYMHCTYGSDRTGTIIFLLQGVLGLSEEDMHHEFCLTAFENSLFAQPTRLAAVTDGLEKYEGDTLSERVVDFLTKEIGVTTQEIESIREILLEE